MFNLMTSDSWTRSESNHQTARPNVNDIENRAARMAHWPRSGLNVLTKATGDYNWWVSDPLFRGLASSHTQSNAGNPTSEEDRNPARSPATQILAITLSSFPNIRVPAAKRINEYYAPRFRKVNGGAKRTAGPRLVAVYQRPGNASPQSLPSVQSAAGALPVSFKWLKQT